jgi:pimeloyl-ACP methyl ester carboxylesterase
MLCCIITIIGFIITTILILLKNILFGAEKHKLGGMDNDTIWVKMEGDGPRGVLFIPGLDDHKSFNWNEADGLIIEKTKWARNSGIQEPISKYATTVSFDPPGFGKSIGAKVPKTVTEYCQIIHDQVSKFLPNSILVVGHSIGGRVAEVYQTLYPGEVHDVLVLDPTPDFVIESLESDDKITQKYINMLRSGKYPENIPDNVHVHYNVDESEDIMLTKFMTRYKNPVPHLNQTSHFHIVDPQPIINAIVKIMLGDRLAIGMGKPVTEILPKHSPDIGSDEVVVATTERWLALMQIVEPVELDYGYIEGSAYIGEITESAFEKLHASGYIYWVKSDKFMHDHRLPHPQNEFISYDPAEIVSVEEIADVWEELQKEKIEFIKFDDMETWIRKHNQKPPGKPIEII